MKLQTTSVKTRERSMVYCVKRIPTILNKNMNLMYFQRKVVIRICLILKFIVTSNPLLLGL